MVYKDVREDLGVQVSIVDRVDFLFPERGSSGNDVGVVFRFDEGGSSGDTGSDGRRNGAGVRVEWCECWVVYGSLDGGNEVCSNWRNKIWFQHVCSVCS